MCYVRYLHLNFFMSRADDFDGKNAVAHNSSNLDLSEHLKIITSMTRGIE
jgi:hypothetical protein